MTKFRIAEQIRRELNLTFEYQQELMILVNQAFAKIVRARLFENKNLTGEMEVNGTFIYPFEVDVQKDDMHYCLFPSTAVDLPMNMGLYHVSLTESPDEPFVVITDGQYGLFKGLQAENMNGRKRAFPLNNKIYFPDFKDSDNIQKVLVKLVVALNDLPEDEELALPPDIEFDIIQTVVGVYKQKMQPENPLQK